MPESLGKKLRKIPDLTVLTVNKYRSRALLVSEPGELALGVSARGKLNLIDSLLKTASALDIINKLLVSYRLGGGAAVEKSLIVKRLHLTEKPLFHHYINSSVHPLVEPFSIEKINGNHSDVDPGG